MLLIDTSYYVFHRFHATLKWFLFQDPDPEHDRDRDLTVPCANPEFVEAFTRHFTADVKKWQKRWRVGSNIVFCLDCPRSEIWRNDIYPGYKGTRVTGSSFDPSIFPIFYTLLMQKGYKTLAGPRLEADDVVYLVINQLLHMDPTIIVLTNDNDYLQLRSMSDKISIHNMQTNVDKSDLSARSKGSPELDLCLKIVMGDASDNIPAIAAKMGPKTALKLATELTVSPQDTESTHAVIVAKLGGDCLERYKMNERLVSFQHIPDELAQHFRTSCTINYT